MPDVVTILEELDKEAIKREKMRSDFMAQIYGRDEKIRLLRSALKDARNELCLKRGNYHESYAGACDGCRWKEDYVP